MREVLMVIAATVTAAIAQNAPQAQPATGSISGVVRDAGTGTPMPEVQVSVNPSQTEMATDSQGHYTLRGLAPGTYRVAAHGQTTGVKHVTLAAGQDLTSIDFALRAFAQISGKVLDENKEPIHGIRVFLVAREYRLGALRYVFAGTGETDDRGAYHLLRAHPGHAYLIMAEKRVRKLEAISGVPADPKLRKRVPAPTYYPDSTSLDGGQPVTLRAGERREGMDIRMTRSASFCMEGTLETNGTPAALFFRDSSAAAHQWPLRRRWALHYVAEWNLRRGWQDSYLRSASRRLPAHSGAVFRS